MTDVEAGYRGDLAHVQDAGFGDFARGAAPGLLLALAEDGIRDGLVVDLGCGSGIWAEILLAAGYDVHGIDLSADLLEIARRRAPGARFEQGTLLDAGLPPCVAVTAIGEVLGYAFDPRTGADAVTALFGRDPRRAGPRRAAAVRRRGGRARDPPPAAHVARGRGLAAVRRGLRGPRGPAPDAPHHALPP